MSSRRERTLTGLAKPSAELLDHPRARHLRLSCPAERKSFTPAGRGEACSCGMQCAGVCASSRKPVLLDQRIENQSAVDTPEHGPIGGIFRS